VRARTLTPKVDRLRPCSGRTVSADRMTSLMELSWTTAD
jgi:hypothetical protein